MGSTRKQATVSAFQEALEQTGDGRSNQCRLCKLINSMENDHDRTALVAALDDPQEYGATRIARALAKIGHGEIKDYTVTRHRRQGHGSSGSADTGRKP